MSGCTECGAPLGPRNKTGFCRKHAFAGAWTSPGFAEKHRAGVLRKIAQDPEYKDKLRARARALSADKSVSDRRSRKFIENKTWEKGSIAARLPEARAKAGRTNSERRLAWCPSELRDEYRALVNTHHYKAAEARQMIEAQHELEMARWRRSVGIEVAPTPFEPVEPSEPDLTPLESAIELVAHRCNITVGKLFADDRHAPLVRARAALAIAMKRQGYSSPKIAQAMHKADHTTALNWVRKGEYLFDRDRQFAALVDELSACWHQLEVAA